MSKRANRFLSDAQLQALVRYGPEIGGLVELARQAKENYTTGVAQARGTAQGIIGAVDRARPEVQHVYDQAGLTQAGVAHVIGDSIQSLPGTANSIKAAADLEAGTATSRIGESRAASLDELAQRRVQAKTGQQFATQSARREFVSELGKVMRRMQDVRRERGAFTASTLNSLMQQDLDRQTRLQIEQMGNTQSERNSIRSSGIDPNTGKPIPGGKADKKKFKAQTPGDAAAAADAVGQALPWLQRAAAKGTPIEDAIAILQSGAKEKPVYETVRDPATGKTKRQTKVDPRTGAPVTIPAIPKIGSKLLLQAAAEAIYQGYVSRKTIRALHRRGLRVDALGLPKPKRSNTGQVRPQTGSPV